MPQDNPPLLDKTMNTTESTPRNIADVLASGLANIANNVKPDGSDISIDVPGMSANNVDDGFSELKQSLTEKIDKHTNWEVVRIGNFIILKITGQPTLKSDGYTLDGTVSSDVRPIYDEVRAFTKIYNGSAYVDCLVQMQRTGDVRLYDLWGSPISGIRTDFLRTNPIIFYDAKIN